nr:triadin isoform X3 [Ovis aries]
MEPAKSPKKEQSAPTEKHIKAKTEQTKEEVGSASSKKAVPGKKEEKTTKTVEQEIRKEKSGKTSSVLKDKEPIKEKEVKVPASLKEKEPEIKKDEKMSKAGKEVKPKSPQPQVKKQEKPESQVKKEAKPASSEKAQIHKQETVKPEKAISHGKPVLHFTESGDEKVVKHVKATTIEKTEKAEHQGKESPSIKTDKPKPTPKETLEVTESAKKKIEKPEKESKGKYILRHVYQISDKSTRIKNI